MFVIDQKDKSPLYEQLIHQLRRQIELGIAEAGTPLPSVRALSAELGVNPNTVQKAYRMMEAEGLICSVQGKGSFISGDTDALRRKQSDLRLQQLRDTLAALRQSGVSGDAVRTVVEEVYAGENKEE